MDMFKTLSLRKVSFEKLLCKNEYLNCTPSKFNNPTNLKIQCTYIKRQKYN